MYLRPIFFNFKNKGVENWNSPDYVLFLLALIMQGLLVGLFGSTMHQLIKHWLISVFVNTHTLNHTHTINEFVKLSIFRVHVFSHLLSLALSFCSYRCTSKMSLSHSLCMIQCLNWIENEWEPYLHVILSYLYTLAYHCVIITTEMLNDYAMCKY